MSEIVVTCVHTTAYELWMLVRIGVAWSLWARSMSCVGIVYNSVCGAVDC